VDAFFNPWLRGSVCKLGRDTGKLFKVRPLMHWTVSLLTCLQALSHYKLHMRIYNKATMVPGKVDIHSTESGTTRQDLRCGTVNKCIGSKKYAYCDPAQCGCGRDVSRDGGAACANGWAGICNLRFGSEYVHPCWRCSRFSLPRLPVSAGCPSSPTATCGAGEQPAPFTRDLQRSRALRRLCRRMSASFSMTGGLAESAFPARNSLC
jgi:hypothetical protein